MLRERATGRLDTRFKLYSLKVLSKLVHHLQTRIDTEATVIKGQQFTVEEMEVLLVDLRKAKKTMPQPCTTTKTIKDPVVFRLDGSSTTAMASPSGRSCSSTLPVSPPRSGR